LMKTSFFLFLIHIFYGGCILGLLFLVGFAQSLVLRFRAFEISLVDIVSLSHPIYNIGMSE
jgi:hypothetical protein